MLMRTRLFCLLLCLLLPVMVLAEDIRAINGQ